MKIVVAGDFCPCARVAIAFEEENYAMVLNEVQNLTAQADYSIVNFECPVVTSDAKPILKCGPNLRCSSNGVKALKFAGFDCVTLANNHFYDFGEEGVEETLSLLDSEGIEYVGGGRNIKDASRILYKHIKGQSIAIINCCEHEFSIATENTSGSNPLDPIQQYYAIKEAKSQVGKVLVIVHGGHEHWQLPSLRMIETYRFFIDSGADAVVNHHQHCFSGYEVYKGCPIFYGLGNFCFDNPDKRSGIWTEGYAVTIEFSGENCGFELHPYRQCGEKPKVELLSKDAYSDKLFELNDIITDSNKLEKEVRRYYNSIRQEISQALSPIGNRYYRAAISRGWAPSFVFTKRKLRIENITCCEAHRDKLQFFLNKRIK